MKGEGKEKLARMLSREIAIEYKACLYFSCIMFFYIVYLMIQRVYVASIPVIWGIILTAYGVGYMQVYLLHNFDEAERFTGREAAGCALGTAVYAVVAWRFGWFGKNVWAMVLFVVYMLFVYLCVFLCNKIKRDIDTKNLNRMLAAYQEGEGHEGE